jgi:hypothetical protein
MLGRIYLEDREGEGGYEKKILENQAMGMGID